MPLTNKQYLKGDEPVCPFCQNKEVEFHGIDFEGKIMKQEVSCYDCDKEWYDIYVLQGWEER
jgi:C4-type Zn-finger protein